MIREMKTEDLDKVAGLLGGLAGKNFKAAVLRARFERIDKNTNAFFVAVMDSKLVGWIQVERRELFVLGVRSEIMGLVVDASVRRQGIGAALMAKAESWVNSHNALPIRLTSNLKREESHLFYKGIGYTLQKKSAVYHKLSLV